MLSIHPPIGGNPPILLSFSLRNPFKSSNFQKNLNGKHVIFLQMLCSFVYYFSATKSLSGVEEEIHPLFDIIYITFGSF